MKLFEGFATKRLRITSWRDELAEAERREALETTLQEILSPTVLAPLPEPLQLGEEADAIAQWISDRESESDVYTIRDASQVTVIGLLIVAAFGDGTAHIGYLFGERYWGRGYATELLSGLVSTLRDRGQPIDLIGGVEVTNPASARVLVKTGFARDPGRSTGATDMFVLRLGRP